MAQTIGSIDLASLKNLRDDLTQYFWFESDATATYGAGAHVTLVPDTSFISNPTGQNILMNTDGFSIRNGLLPMMTLDNNSLDFNVVDTTEGTYVTTASFSSTGAQIGQIGESHLEMDYHSMQMKDKEDDTYFFVSDLRDDNGKYVFTESFTITSLYVSYPLSLTATNTSYTVTFSPSWSGSFTKSTTSIYFPSNPPNGTIMTVTYTTVDQNTKAYTLGLRGTGVVGPMSIASNYGNVASGKSSHAEGDRTIASGYASHAEGGYTDVYGGGSPTASGYASHAEGVGTKAISRGSHAEGDRTRAEGYYFNHAEGSQTVASGYYTHAEGYKTKTEGYASHAEGYGTVAMGNHQTVVGRYNKKDSSGGNGVYAFIIGNGSGDDTASRSNALTVDWDGNVEAAGEVHGTLSNPTISITASTGTLQSATVYKQGNVVQLLVSVQKTTATASGQNVFAGTINTTALRPKMTTTSGTYYGSYALNAIITTDGVITIRNADSRQFDAMTLNGNISFTYLID